MLGVSLKILAPTGQYDPTKLVNWGTNRWAFKPELGYSKRWNNWFLDSYAGVWFYTTNPQYYSPPIPKPQSEQPIGSFEGHLSYDVKATTLVFAGRKFLVRRRYQLEWHSESRYASDELPHRRHGFDPVGPAPVGKGQLQQRRLHPIWRKLSECCRRVAILLARQA